MESLRGFIRRHGKMSRAAFVKTFSHPFLASPPPRGRDKDDPENLFPGAWVIPIVKRKDGNRLDARVTLGRAGHEDIWIDDGSVSKEHCYFQLDKRGARIADANSTNGTFVNGRRLNPHVTRALCSKDKIGIGEKIELHFFSPEDLFETLFQGDSKE